MSELSCSVCQSTSYKYRCPSCRATSCSLQCSRTHKSQCDQADPENDQLSRSVINKPPQPDETDALPVLIQDSRLQKLFEQYPNLRSRLKSIFEIAVVDGYEKIPPTRSSPPQRHRRSPEQRIAQAMRVLDLELSSETAEIDGLKAFADLVAEGTLSQSDHK